MPINVLKKIWPEWSIGKRIGGGAYGTVYEASRNEYGVENHAAIKIISIPASEAEIDTLRSEGLDMQATKTHFQTIVNDFVNEIRLMVSLEGRPNIVNVKDYKVVEKKDAFGWYIFILMELLTPFAVYTCDHQMTEAEVIKLGCDICTALETCAEEKIIHRDIKPGNILVHKSGDFKLGDFGIARKLENMTGGLSQRYTPKYMAPEVATSMNYDERVDIYSLGIVLYELLNGRRIPFQPNKQINSLADIETAVRRRNNGEAFDGPSNASPAMADLILRACAYDPDMRFSTATEMKQALQSVANGTYKISANKTDRTKSVRKAPGSYDKTKSVRKPPAAGNQQGSSSDNIFGSKQRKKSSLPAVLSVVLVLVLLAGIGTFLIKMNMDKQAEIDAIIEEAQVLADSEDFVGAIAKIEDGLDEYSDEDKLQDKLDEYQVSLTNQQISTMITNADALASTGDYEGAIEFVEGGLADYPDNSALLGKITEYNAALAAQVKTQTLADAQSLADAGEYESAMAMIKAAQEAYGEDKDYDTAYMTYHKAYSLTEAETYVADGDYPSAIKLIAEAQKVNTNDVDLIAAYNTYCDSYVTAVVATADALMAEWKIDEAILEIKSGLKVVPNNTELSEKLDVLNASKPIPITTLTSINSSRWYWNDGKAVDPFGNDYSGASNYVIFHNKGYNERSIEYRVYGDYQMITGVIAPHAEIDKDGTCTVLVYADEQLVYTSPAIGQKTDALTFSADISDAEYIKIEVQFSHHYAWDVFVDQLIISNVQLWP